MNPHEFESRLQRTPLKQPPAEWREEILVAAHSSATADACNATTNASPTSGLFGMLTVAWQRRLRELFWPHPIAWGVIAVLWMAIGAVHLAIREPGQPTAQHYLAIDSDLPTPMTLQRELLASWDEPAPQPRTVPVRPIPPQSCIERRRVTLAA